MSSKRKDGPLKGVRILTESTWSHLTDLTGQRTRNPQGLQGGAGHLVANTFKLGDQKDRGDRYLGGQAVGWGGDETNWPKAPTGSSGFLDPSCCCPLHQ